MLPTDTWMQLVDMLLTAAYSTVAYVQGDFCTSCGAPFLRSFITFEVLPLVEFELEPGISDAEALVRPS